MKTVVTLALLTALLVATAVAATVTERVNALFDQALVQIRYQELDAALATAREAVTLAPTASEAWMIVGYVRQEREELELAVAAFRKAARLAPQRPLPWADLAWTYYKLGYYRQMEQAARQAAKLAPDLAVAWRDLATAQWNQGSLDEAIASFRQALRLDPYNGRYRSFLAGALAEKGLEDESLAEYEAGLNDLRNQAAEGYNSLAWSLQNAGDMVRSAGAAAQAIQLAASDATRAEAYNALAHAQMYVGQFPAAQKTILLALKTAPQDSYYRDTAAAVALLQNDLPEAEKHLAAAMEGKTAESYLSPTLPLLWARQGKREQAVAQLERVEKALTTSGGRIPDDFYLVGKAWLALGETARARKVYAAGAAKFPKHPWGIEMQRWVEANP